MAVKIWETLWFCDLFFSKLVHLQQLQEIQSSKIGMWKVYHLSIKVFSLSSIWHQGKGLPTVFRSYKHNKQLLKHDKIFLELNKHFSKHNTVLPKHNESLSKHNVDYWNTTQYYQNITQNLQNTTQFSQNTTQYFRKTTPNIPYYVMQDLLLYKAQSRVRMLKVQSLAFFKRFSFGVSGSALIQNCISYLVVGISAKITIFSSVP